MRPMAYVVLGLVAVAIASISGETSAQMRTGKGEYYSGIQRKPWPSYLHFWITGRDDPAAEGAPARKDASGEKPPNSGEKYPVR